MFEAAMLPPDDRGLAYGDGVFETLLFQQGHPMLWDWHCARLERGCRQLGFAPPSREALIAEAQAVPAEGAHILKIIVTRGSGGRGYGPPAVATPRLIGRVLPFVAQPLRWQQGVKVRLCALILASQPRLAGIKHLNRLENVLARQEWQDPNLAEGLLCNARGELIEATAMNIAWCKEGCWYTPLTDECGVTGTLCAALIAAGQLKTARLPLEQVRHVDHLCVLNSVQGVWPVQQLDDQHQQCVARYDITRQPVLAFQQQAHQLLGHATLI